MKVSDLLRKQVTDGEGRSLGRVHDLYVIQDGPQRASGHAAFRVHGLAAGPFAIGTRLGYTTPPGVQPTIETRGPLPLRALFRMAHRHAIYIPWQDITDITDTTISIRTNPRP